MLFSVEQAFVGRDEKRAPLKTPAWEARSCTVLSSLEIIQQIQEPEVHEDQLEW